MGNGRTRACLRSSGNSPEFSAFIKKILLQESTDQHIASNVLQEWDQDRMFLLNQI